MKDDLKVECNGVADQKQSTLGVLITLPDGRVNVRKTISCRYVILFLFVFCFCSSLPFKRKQLKGAWNKVLSESFCSVKFSLMFSTKYKVIWKESMAIDQKSLKAFFHAPSQLCCPSE